MDDSLPFADELQIDRLADQFERAFKAGERPKIEDYLDTPLRPHVLKELLRLEVELRQAAGEKPTITEYRSRFPGDKAIVEAALGGGIDKTGDNPPPEGDDEPPLTQLGRYQIQRCLGRGGFGVVYLAHDPQLDRPVALKVPRRKRFESPEQVASFVREARTAARLKHPLLVAL